MTRLVRAEAYKLLRGWIVLGILVAIATFLVVVCGKTALKVPENALKTHEIAHKITVDGLVPLWCGVVLATFVIAREFETRTIARPILRGYARGAVFAAKAVVYFSAGLALSMAALVAMLLIYAPVWPDGLAARIVCDVGTLSVPFALAFLCRDLVRTVSFSGAYALVVTMLARGAIAADGVLAWHPLVRLAQGAPGEAVTISAAITLLCVGAAYAHFCRSTLR